MFSIFFFSNLFHLRSTDQNIYATIVEAQGCRVNSCKFGGTCVLGTDGSETCQCREGFTGAQCEIGNKLLDIFVLWSNLLETLDIF